MWDTWHAMIFENIPPKEHDFLFLSPRFDQNLISIHFYINNSIFLYLNLDFPRHNYNGVA
jgi:hypothetical protein